MTMVLVLIAGTLVRIVAPLGLLLLVGTLVQRAQARQH